MGIPDNKLLIIVFLYQAFQLPVVPEYFKPFLYPAISSGRLASKQWLSIHGVSGNASVNTRRESGRFKQRPPKGRIMHGFQRSHTIGRHEQIKYKNQECEPDENTASGIFPDSPQTKKNDRKGQACQS